MQPGLCFFSERVINVWNSLSHDITNFCSVTAFKRSLRGLILHWLFLVCLCVVICLCFKHCNVSLCLTVLPHACLHVIVSL